MRRTAVALACALMTGTVALHAPADQPAAPPVRTVRLAELRNAAFATSLGAGPVRVTCLFKGIPMTLPNRPPGVTATDGIGVADGSVITARVALAPGAFEQVKASARLDEPLVLTARLVWAGAGKRFEDLWLDVSEVFIGDEASRAATADAKRQAAEAKRRADADAAESRRREAEAQQRADAEAAARAKVLAEGSGPRRCNPPCRRGYACSAEGKCLSECNPPCEAGLLCRDHDCVPPNAAPATPASRPTARAAHPDSAPPPPSSSLAADDAPPPPPRPVARPTYRRPAPPAGEREFSTPKPTPEGAYLTGVLGWVSGSGYCLGVNGALRPSPYFAVQIDLNYAFGIPYLDANYNTGEGSGFTTLVQGVGMIPVGSTDGWDLYGGLAGGFIHLSAGATETASAYGWLVGSRFWLDQDHHWTLGLEFMNLSTGLKKLAFGDANSGSPSHSFGRLASTLGYRW